MIVFPSVAFYDTLVSTVRREVQKPLIPGQFTWNSFLDRSMSWQDYRLTITAPATLPLNTEQHGIDMEREQEGGRVIYRFHAAYPYATARDPAVVGPFQRMPRVFVSSLPDYAALARTYAELALPKAAVTPDNRNLLQTAPELTGRYPRFCSSPRSQWLPAASRRRVLRGRITPGSPQSRRTLPPGGHRSTGTRSMAVSFHPRWARTRSWEPKI